MNLGLSDGTGKLNSAMKVLVERWEETKLRWRDPVQQAFEKDFWAPLESEVIDTLRAMDRLAVILNQVQQDCR